MGALSTTCHVMSCTVPGLIVSSLQSLRLKLLRSGKPRHSFPKTFNHLWLDPHLVLSPILWTPLSCLGHRESLSTGFKSDKLLSPLSVTNSTKYLISVSSRSYSTDGRYTESFFPPLSSFPSFLFLLLFFLLLLSSKFSFSSFSLSSLLFTNHSVCGFNIKLSHLDFTPVI